MNMKSYYGKTGILHSSLAEEGAQNLLRKIEDSILEMDILPNQYEQFTGALEETDYISYGRFMQSVNGQKVLKMLEEEDAEGFIEL